MNPRVQTDEVPWSEKLIVVCTKCGKKADPTAELNPADRIKNELKAQITKEQRKSQIRAVTSSCLDICPEGRIAIVESTRTPQGQTRAFTVDPKITGPELIETFLPSSGV